MRVALFIPSYGDGGVERDFVNIARGLVELGVEIDFVTARRDVPYLGSLPDAVSLITLGGTTRASAAFNAFLNYLRKRRPDVLMSGKDEAHESALAARAQSGTRVSLIMRPGTIVSAKYRRSRFWRRGGAYQRMRKSYSKADLIVAVSQGVARDTAKITGTAKSDIEVIRSPILTPALYELAGEPVSHPWLVDKRCPVVVAIGGLRRQKGFADLLRAFSLARQTGEMRLLIVGQGRLRRPLQKLAQRLGIGNAVDFTGFLENPYPLLARADLFVLSSLWEGLGNVVVEAVGLGRRVVATDCPSGPREILENNPHAVLTPVANPQALARGMLLALKQKAPDPTAVQSKVADYTLKSSADRYKTTMERLALKMSGPTC